jgi:hypothetical protein
MAGRIQFQKALQQAYDRNIFIKDVLSPVFGQHLRISNLPLWADDELNASDKRVIESVQKYGRIQLADFSSVTCYEIRLKPSVRIENSRVAIQQYVRRLLIAGQAALINFVSAEKSDTWRLTLVARDSDMIDGEIKDKLTHPKRYTYLLGTTESCRTAAERLEALSTETTFTLKVLINAFSVDKLGKAFFEEYNLHYKRLCNYLQDSAFRQSVFNIAYPADASAQEKEQANKPIRDFVKKTLGRIVFLYFVQKKGWLGATDTRYQDGSTDFMRRLFEQSGGDDTFYPNHLSRLFFETLNRQRPNDDFIMPDGTKLKVPFLNGGLFDRDAYDEATLIIPAHFFHHPHYMDSVPTAKTTDDELRGFLDFLNAYNFTVHEDSPDDHTVAVDPEMLGHIFENLLEDNKDKGAFYTPKHIVHYMCQESLIEYLTNHLSREYKVYRPIGSDQVELFGNEHRQGQLKLMQELGEEALNRDQLAQMVRHKQVSNLPHAQLQRIDALLDAVKICDPSIGSGAFPMGLLQEIYALKELIAFQLGKPWQPARAKQNIIQNSIYGVDIERGAVDIARLRFWLSLVVDEEKPQPLPNLDYKIMQGNSLVGQLGNDLLQINWQIEHGRSKSQGYKTEEVNTLKNLAATVAKLSQQYFNAPPPTKQSLNRQITNTKADILLLLLRIELRRLELLSPNQSMFQLSAKEKAAQTMRELQIAGIRNNIKALEKAKAEGATKLNYFDWQLDFPEVLSELITDAPGFDILIGNPPYIQLQKDGGKLAKMYEKQGFETFVKTGDIYSLFYEKGIQLLKEGGTLNYITSNKWMRADYGKATRAFFAKYNPLLLIDLGSGVFESATVDSNILLIQKAPNRNQLLALDISKEKKGTSNINAFADRFVRLKNLSADAWTIATDIEQSIKAKIEAKGTPLKEWDVQIYRGVLTGYNEAFIIDGATKDRLIAEDPKSAEIIKPILRGRDIKRYKAEFADLWLINAHNGVKGKLPRIDVPKDYPAVYKHLLQFEEQLQKRLDKGDHWTNLRNCAYIQEFEKEKIVYNDICQTLTFSKVEKGMFFNNTAYFINEYSGYLLSLLNSKIIDWYYRTLSVQLGEKAVRMFSIYVENIPIPKISESEQQPFVELVERILAGKERGADTTAWEQEIDLLVYRLYGLSYEEVLVIDPAFPLSREEYEGK